MGRTSETKQQTEPEWVARFLAAMRTAPSVKAACRVSGVPEGTAYRRRGNHPDFAREWARLQGGKGAAAPAPNAPWGGVPRIGAKKLERFLEALADSSNVRAAAALAGIDPRKIYRLRRDDPDFARRWYAALAEGYDNLEMELLEHLRSGGEAGEAAGRKFDTAIALRCLTAHRESVAREKGRRSLADEVTTIAALNAKIDALRERAEENEQVIRAARAKGADDGEA